MRYRAASIAAMSALPLVLGSTPAYADDEAACKFTNPPGASVDPSRPAIDIDLQFTFACYEDPEDPEDPGIVIEN